MAEAATSGTWCDRSVASTVSPLAKQVRPDRRCALAASETPPPKVQINTQENEEATQLEFLELPCRADVLPLVGSCWGIRRGPAGHTTRALVTKWVNASWELALPKPKEMRRSAR